MSVVSGNDHVICQQEQKNIYQETFDMLPEKEPMTVNDKDTTKLNQKLNEVQKESGKKKVMKSREKKAKIGVHEKMPKLSIRFDGVQHIPDFDDINERKGFRCKRDKCGKQTTVFCEKCQVHLCFVPGKSNRGRNCFKKFHQLNES